MAEHGAKVDIAVDDDQNRTRRCVGGEEVFLAVEDVVAQLSIKLCRDIGSSSSCWTAYDGNDGHGDYDREESRDDAIDQLV